MNHHNFLKDLGAILVTRRKELKITQVEAAEKLDISYRYYQKIERGHVNMTSKTIFNILEGFGIGTLVWRKE